MTKQNDAAFSAEHRQYIARLNRSRRGIKLARWLILIVFIALWELFARVGIIDPFIGSSPVRVAETIARLYAGGELFLHIGVTLYETVLGFVLGTAAGPVGIVSMIGQAVRTGFETVLRLGVLISANLGLMNLLPLPALDGGRLVFLIIEAVRGKPVPPEKEGIVHLVGLVLLLCLVVFLTISDVRTFIIGG